MKQAAIDGIDEEFSGFVNNRLMPLFSTANSGRSQLDMGFGINYVFKNTLKGLRIATELRLPVTQEVNGIQMKNGLMGTMGIQYALGH